MAVKPWFKDFPCALRRLFVRGLAAGICCSAAVVGANGDEGEAGKSAFAEESLPKTVEEARGRARWMHEAIHGTLQMMHRDFFDEEETNRIPSASIEDVFAEMARSWLVEFRWLGVNATKDIDHEPVDRFEEAAVVALAAGEKEYEEIWQNSFRFAGAIQLKNQCLKCHVPNRTTLEDRVAGLVITIPLHGKTDD